MENNAIESGDEKTSESIGNVDEALADMLLKEEEGNTGNGEKKDDEMDTGADEDKEEKPQIHGRYVFPETLIRGKVLQEQKEAWNHQKVVVYPVDFDDLGNSDFRELISTAVACQLKFMPVYFQRTSQGMMELFMRSPTDAQQLVEKFYSKRPDLNAVIQGDTPFGDITDKSEICEKGPSYERTLCVYGLPPTATEDRLLELYPGYCALLKRDKEGNCTGQGFVDFETKEELDHVVSKLKYTKTNVRRWRTGEKKPVKEQLTEDMVEHMDFHKLSVFSMATIPATTPERLTSDEIDRHVHKSLKYRVRLSKEWETKSAARLIKYVEVIEKLEKELKKDQQLRLRLGDRETGSMPLWYPRLQKAMSASAEAKKVSSSCRGYITTGVDKLRTMIEERLKTEDIPDDLSDFKVSDDEEDQKKKTQKREGQKSRTPDSSSKRPRMADRPGGYGDRSRGRGFMDRGWRTGMGGRGGMGGGMGRGGGGMWNPKPQNPAFNRGASADLLLGLAQIIEGNAGYDGGYSQGYHGYDDFTPQYKSGYSRGSRGRRGGRGGF